VFEILRESAFRIAGSMSVGIDTACLLDGLDGKNCKNGSCYEVLRDVSYCFEL